MSSEQNVRDKARDQNVDYLPFDDEQIVRFRTIAAIALRSPSETQWETKLLEDAKAEAQRGSKKKTQLDDDTSSRQAGAPTVQAQLGERRGSIIFVTNRNDEHTSEAKMRFGSRWVGEPLKCGMLDYVADVNRLMGTASDEIAFRLGGGVQVGFDECLRFIESTLSSEKADDVLIFMHGYYNTFASSAQTAIRLALDTRFEGITVVLCWPSNGNLPDYFPDENIAERVAPTISEFATALLLRNEKVKFQFMAHSVGARILLQIVAKVASDPQAKNLYSVTFAAPDEKKTTFEEIIERSNRAINAGHLYQIGTLYASNSDRALKVAAALHHDGVPRAGSVGDDILVMDDVESIEAGELNGGLMGHQYIFTDTRALRDLGFLLQEHRPAVRRLLDMRRKNRWVYYLPR